MTALFQWYAGVDCVVDLHYHRNVYSIIEKECAALRVKQKQRLTERFCMISGR